MPKSIMWFRRDLRLSDSPALLHAAADGEVVGLFVLDPSLLRPSGAPRTAMLYRTLRALDAQLDGKLVIRHGKPASVVAAVVDELGAHAVHAAHDFGPYGNRRDADVASQLRVPLVFTDSPYAVPPGEVRNGSGSGYQVYSAFYRAWREAGWASPMGTPEVRWAHAASEGVPADPALPSDLELPEVGEPAALRAWHDYVAGGLAEYANERDRPDLDSTSRMSVHLKWGTIHPRTLLADLGASASHETYRKELAWREFYADVLFHSPQSAREYYHAELNQLPYATGKLAEDRFAAWAAGRTGYPIVDAGMRQLLGEGWMHNRVRMIVASFLVKDLHLEWIDGARHFLAHLIDGDLASNNHGWQWVAGSGTDAAPYFRIFNPTLQGKRFDPHGDYVRRWVPELRHLSAKVIHEPWRDPNGAPADYPDRLVDHDVERKATLADYQALRRGR